MEWRWSYEGIDDGVGVELKDMLMEVKWRRISETSIFE
jgi:hypothetical protein